MDSVISVNHQYVSGTASVSSCGEETFAQGQMIRNKNNERIDRRVGSLDRDQKDLTFADILNIDTTYSRISKDV